MEASTLSEGQITLQEVIAEGHRYHPFQLIELLQRLTVSKTPIRMRPSDSLAFPAGDVERVEQSVDGSLNVQVRFDGFYGVDSPLPHYFLEDTTVDTDSAERIRTFLDIFNLPFYQLHQEAWQASRFYDASSNKLGTLSRILNNLLPPNIAETRECLQYPGLYLHGRPSIKSLAAMLRQLLGCPTLKLDTDTCSWQPLSQPSRLGEPLVINGCLSLGRRVAVRGQLLTIRMGRLSLTKAKYIQPGGHLSLLLVRALKAALPDDMEWVVEFLTQSDAQARQLGRKKITLGRAGILTNQQDEWLNQRYVSSQYRYLIQPLK